MTDSQLRSIEEGLAITFPNLRRHRPIHKLGEGWGSIAVRTNDGLVFRIAKNRVIQEQHRRQVKILRIISNQIQRVQVPIPQYWAGSSPEFPFGVMGYREIGGSTPIRTKVMGNAQFSSELAKLLLEFHSVQLPADLGAADFPGIPNSAEVLENSWTLVTSWLADRLNRQDYRTIKDEWQNIMNRLESFPGNRTLVHGDPWYENIVVGKDMHIVGIVDFDKVSVGDTAIDFGVQQYVGTQFMHDVIQQYIRQGGDPGDNLAERITMAMQIKSIQDLVYEIETASVHRGTLARIKKSFTA